MNKILPIWSKNNGKDEVLIPFLKIDLLKQAPQGIPIYSIPEWVKTEMIQKIFNGYAWLSATAATTSTTISKSTTRSTSSSTSRSTTQSTSQSTSTSSTTTSTSTTLATDSGGLAFGEQSPTGGETAVSWQTFTNGAAAIPNVIGGLAWGKMEIAVNAEGRSAVYNFGSSTTRYYKMKENKYGTGIGGSGTLQIRGSDSIFLQDDVLPAWSTYSLDIAVTSQYIQFRVTITS